MTATTKTVTLNLPDATAVADVIDSCDNPSEALFVLGRLLGEAAARCQRLARIASGHECKLSASRGGVRLTGDEAFTDALVSAGVAKGGEES